MRQAHGSLGHNRRVIMNRNGPLLVLGAGYVGAELAAQALAAGHEVVLADNWYATDRAQLGELEANGAGVETADIRERGDVERLLALEPSCVFLLAAQASRPVSEREPDYTEATNATGVRHVAETATVPVVFASSLHVYGAGLTGDIGPNTPYGPQGDLAHLSKIYGELVLSMHARARFPLALMRLGIVYGPSPVEHDRPDSQTVVDKFRRLAAAGKPLPVDDGGAAIGVVHVEDAARILLEARPEGIEAQNVAAETLTVADVARLASGEDPADDPGLRYPSPFQYWHRVADYLLG
jgi:UDP-glucuronate decarboxylase